MADELPEKPEAVSFGDRRPGVICKVCASGIALGDIETLPDEFDLTCGRCGKRETYRATELQTLRAGKTN
jgi:hypothetical protein